MFIILLRLPSPRQWPRHWHHVRALTPVRNGLGGASAHIAVEYDVVIGSRRELGCRGQVLPEPELRDNPATHRIPRIEVGVDALHVEVRDTSGIRFAEIGN